MKPNTIILEDDGLYCFEAPEKPDFQKTFAIDKTYIWDKYLCDLKLWEQALEAAKNQKVKFKNQSGVMDIYYQSICTVKNCTDLTCECEWLKKGKLYPVPENYTIKIEYEGGKPTNGPFGTFMFGETRYAILVPKQEPVNQCPICNIPLKELKKGTCENIGCESIFFAKNPSKELVDQLFSHLKQPTSIEEAAIDYCSQKYSNNGSGIDWANGKEGFIAGAKYQEGLAEAYLNKIKELCETVNGNLLQMPAAIQAIQALIIEFKQEKK